MDETPLAQMMQRGLDGTSLWMQYFVVMIALYAHLSDSTYMALVTKLDAKGVCTLLEDYVCLLKNIIITEYQIVRHCLIFTIRHLCTQYINSNTILFLYKPLFAILLEMEFMLCFQNNNWRHNWKEKYLHSSLLNCIGMLL